MFCKTALATVLLVVVAASPMDKRPRSSDPMELVNIIEIEEPCVRQGGLCLKIEDCPPGNLVQIRGTMCPMQRHLGVECCYN